MQVREAVETLINALGGELIEARKADDQIRIMYIVNAYNSIYTVWTHYVDDYVSGNPNSLRRKMIEEDLASYEIPLPTE